jgi:hypothetical protein
MKLIAVWTLLATAGCGLTTMKVAPVKVEPIHMTIDVNVRDQTDETPNSDGTTKRR